MRITVLLLMTGLVAACGGGGGGDDAPASPAAPAGGTPQVSGSTALSFAQQGVGTISAAQSLVLTNAGTASLVFQNVAISGPFSITANGCTGSLATGASCTVSIAFAPTAGGAGQGVLTVTTNAAGPAYTVALSGSGVVANGWVAGQFRPSREFEARCAAPRSGVSPVTGIAWPDRPGTALDEKFWMRSWTNELYLWYQDVIDRDPGLYATTAAYYETLKAPQDRFHSTLPTDRWEQLAQSGIEAGYGAAFVLVRAAPPRQAVVAYVEPGSPAAAANLSRGVEILQVDGADFVNAQDSLSITRINAGLFPTAAGETHTLQVRAPGALSPTTVTLTSQNVVSTPVQNVRTLPVAGGTVGYLLFNDHIATSEVALVNAIASLRTAGVADLVLDVRYNGGGFLDIASELAFMIAGPSRTSGRVFERLQFNAKHPTTNPVTGQPITPLPFHPVTRGFSVSAGQALPTLDLGRVYVLTGPGTCSASESIINGLRGVGVEVVQVGSTTCGKPYGFYPRDNCGTTYFSVQFRGVNDANFGDYADGFTPNTSQVAAGVRIPGCAVADDFTRALGDPAEARLAAALAYRATGSCPAATSVQPPALAATVEGPYVPPRADGEVVRSPWRENRILGDPTAPR